ncbi:Cysteine desulfurase [Gossypium arboreum]|uniref:Cysteine desulfurase n=1 Tax=Gossypium arboreum TaxID=29729 RepID=A0A0B0PHD8_GOSAR|nr:Cysteine desulfurase [Gossypium arboreum]
MASHYQTFPYHLITISQDHNVILQNIRAIFAWLYEYTLPKGT